MRIQLRLFLARLNETISKYSLARLEVALHNPASTEPPIVQRLGAERIPPQSSGNEWADFAGAVERVQRYVASVHKKRTVIKRNAAWRNFAAAAAELSALTARIEALHVRRKRGRTR